MHIAVILGSTRPHYRLGERVAKWVMAETDKFPQASYSFHDLRDYSLPFFDEDEGPRGNRNRHPAENVARWLRDVEAADGYIFITPEYNEAPSAALKNAIDFLAFEAHRKPAAIIGYTDGSNGGMYAPIQLRVNLGEVGIIALKTQQIILCADEVLDEGGRPSPQEQATVERRFAHFMADLLWFTEVLKAGRDKQVHPAN